MVLLCLYCPSLLFCFTLSLSPLPTLLSYSVSIAPQTSQILLCITPPPLSLSSSLFISPTLPLSISLPPSPRLNCCQLTDVPSRWFYSNRSTPLFYISVASFLPFSLVFLCVVHCFFSYLYCLQLPSLPLSPHPFVFMLSVTSFSLGGKSVYIAACCIYLFSYKPRQSIDYWSHSHVLYLST